MAKIYGKLSLPQKFAEQLLDCQIQIDLNDKVSPEIIIKLIELYTIGMEYYESIQSYKYLYFQKKMNKIIKSPDIIDTINTSKTQNLLNQKKTLSEQQQERIYNQLKKKKSHNPFKRHQRQRQQLWDKIIEEERKKQKQKREKLEKEQQLKKLKEIQTRQKHQMIQNQILSTTASLSSSKKVKEMIDLHQIKSNQVDQKIKHNITEQEAQLKLKLEQRLQKRKIKKSLSSIDFPVRQKQNEQLQLITSKIQSPEEILTPLDKNFSNIIHQIDSDQEQEKHEIPKN